MLSECGHVSPSNAFRPCPPIGLDLPPSNGFGFILIAPSIESIYINSNCSGLWWIWIPIVQSFPLSEFLQLIHHLHQFKMPKIFFIRALFFLMILNSISNLFRVSLIRAFLEAPQIFNFWLTLDLDSNCTRPQHPGFFDQPLSSLYLICSNTTQLG